MLGRSRYRFRSAFALTLLAMACVTTAKAQTRESVIAGFEARLSRDVQADDIGSIAAGIVVGTDVIWAKAFGFMDRDRAVPANAQTLYRIGSISKSVTAVLMMVLLQQGVISLDDPVAEHLPEFQRLGGGLAEASSITLRQLATHTSGLSREPQLEGAATGPIAEWEQKIIASIPTTTLSGRPGSQYAYSNIGYGILGLALSRAARQPFMDLVQRHVFQPAGMTSSTFIIQAPQGERLSLGYQNGRDGSINAETPALEHAGRGYKVPNGGVYSTVHDLSRFMGIVSGALGDAVLTEQSRAAIMTKQTPGDGQAYGLGFMLRSDDNGNRLVYHSGSVAGYTAFLTFNPETRIGVVLLRNYASGATNLQSAAQSLVTALIAVTKTGTR
jgi:CubicO group peptidase (beta-lactamase class C family)